jgi:hypothetical protein
MEQAQTHAGTVRSAAMVKLQFFTHTPHSDGLPTVAVRMAVAAP